MILNPAYSRAALVQQIQPGSGIYMSGIEIDTSKEQIHNKMIHRNTCTAETSHSTVTGIGRLFYSIAEIYFRCIPYMRHNLYPRKYILCGIRYRRYHQHIVIEKKI